VKIKTAVLLLGYNVEEKNWTETVWGTPPDRPGRIPMAVAVMLEEDADHLIIFGSSLGKEKNGKWLSSGRWMRDWLFARVDTLKQFTILEAFKQLSCNYTMSRIERTFELIEGPEKPSNTFEEIQAMSRIVQERRIRKLICVSSADHISRIIRDVHRVFKGRPIVAHLEVRGSLSLYTENDGKTPSERASVDHVVVIEPRAAIGPYAERMFRVNNNPEALAEIDTVLKRYEKKTR